MVTNNYEKLNAEVVSNNRKFIRTTVAMSKEILDVIHKNIDAK